MEEGEGAKGENRDEGWTHFEFPLSIDWQRSRAGVPWFSGAKPINLFSLGRMLSISTRIKNADLPLCSNITIGLVYL